MQGPVTGARSSDDLWGAPPDPKRKVYDDSETGLDRTANDAAYEYGGHEGFAKTASDAYRAQALAQRNHQSAWDAQTRGQQLALANQLAGPQPTAAIAQAQAGRDAVMRQALAQSGAGAPVGYTAQALQPGTQQALAQGAQTANQEQQQTDQLRGQVLGQGRTQDIAEVGFDAQQNAEMEQFYQKMGFSIDQAQMLAQLNRAKQNVNNWAAFNEDARARVDQALRLAQAQRLTNRQDLNNTMQTAGQTLAILGSVAKGGDE